MSATLNLIKSEYIKKGSLLVLLIHALFGLLVVYKGNFDSYMATVLILYTVCEAILIYGTHQGANKRMVWSVIVLVCMGVCIQNIIGQSTSKTGWFMGICLVLTLLYAFFDKQYTFNKKFLMYALPILSFALALYLILFTHGTNGTKAWLVIGDISLQLSDFIKLAFLYFMALLYSSEYNEKVKFTVSSIYFVVISMFLIAMNELGTILVNLAVYLTFVIIYIKSKKYKRIVLSTIVISALLIIGIYRIDIHLTNTSNSFNTTLLGKIFNKVTERLKVWVNYEGYKYERYGYQALKAKQAALIGGWLGNAEYSVNIPVAASDFVFPAILMKLGLIFGIMVIVLFFNIYYRINYTTSALKIASITALCFQAFIMIAGSINFFIMTGLGVPFLSSGGTNTLVTYILVYNILSRSDITNEK